MNISETISRRPSMSTSISIVIGMKNLNCKEKDKGILMGTCHMVMLMLLVNATQSFGLDINLRLNLLVLFWGSIVIELPCV